MTQQNLDFAELQELKNQFSLLNEKLEKQRIINEELIQESMKEKLSYIERWYMNQFYKNTIAAPIVGIVFMIGFGYWGFSALILTICILQYFLYKRCYLALDIKNLPYLNMTQATENIIKHKQLYNIANKILILPLIVLIVWTILIASGYTWNLKVISITVFMLGLSISWGLSQMKKNQKRLESVLEQIKKLRE